VFRSFYKNEIIEIYISIIKFKIKLPMNKQKKSFFIGYYYDNLTEEAKYNLRKYTVIVLRAKNYTYSEITSITSF